MTRNRVLTILILTFAVYAIVTEPIQSGQWVKGIYDILDQALHSVFAFFSAILQ